MKLASKFSIRWLSSLVALCAGCVQRMYCSAAAAVYKHYLYEIYNGDTIRLSFILRVRVPYIPQTNYIHTHTSHQITVDNMDYLPRRKMVENPQKSGSKFIQVIFTIYKQNGIFAFFIFDWTYTKVTSDTTLSLCRI